MPNDKRIHNILAQVNKFIEGDYRGHLEISGTGDEIDAVSKNLNVLGETLRNQAARLRERSARINSVLDVLVKYSALEFSVKAQVGPLRDEIDSIAAGVNAFGEELSYHITKLKDSEEQIKTIFQNAPDAVVVINSKGIIITWNPAAEKFFGWRESEVTGKLLKDVLIPERYRKKHEAGMARFLKTGKATMLNKSLVLPARCKNNLEVETELTISPAKLKEEYIFIAFLRDITERKIAESKIIQLNATLEHRVAERTEELNQSEKKYRNLFENNPMPLWILELPTLRFLDVNESAIKLYGYSREEFLSMTAVDLRPEEEKDKFLQLDRSGTGTQNAGIWKHRKKDGTIIHAEVSVHEIVYNEKPARFILSNDVTERVKAEEALRYSEARFRKIFDSKLIGFLFWNINGDVREANDLFLEMVGYSRQDLEDGKIDWIKMTPPEYTMLDEVALKQISENGVSDAFEKEYFRKDGSRLPVMMAAAAIDKDLKVSYIMDISQRKKMQEEILQLNKNLEQRVAKRTEELQAANKELESFSYSVSHDLRAPLRAIDGYSQMLLEDYQSKLDEEGIRLLNTVKFNAKRMGQLVDDLLTFSRMGKRPLNKSLSDFDSLVDEVLAGIHQPGNAGIIVNPLGTAYSDASLMRHVFENLITNAIKYSSKKKDPVIEIGMTETGGVKTYFVKDNGAGFDMRYYNKLFGVFQRLHGEDEFEGTGVGLAIVHRIIYKHGGKIWAEGKPNEGATFYFTLV